MISLAFTNAPPSTNNSYINVPGVGRVASKKLKAWKKEAGLEILIQRQRRIDGPVVVDITVKHPAKAKVDVDGKIKAVLDVLVSAGLISDDSAVQKVSAAWSYGDGPGCRVSVAPAAGGAM